MPGLVQHFVDGLIEFQRGQQDPVGLRVEPAGLGVPGAERRGVPAHPVAGDVAPRHLLGMPDELVADGVVERPEHSRDILQRGLLCAALLERSCGLAFKIKNDEIRFGPQNLAEMIVPMDPRLHPAERCGG